MTISLLIKGNFTEADLRELTATFRTIERRQPDSPFLFAIVDSDLTITQGEELVKRIFPHIDGDEPIFQTFKRLEVVCPDGQIRKMITDIGVDFVPDVEQSNLIMVQGTVEIDGTPIKGEAWLRGGRYLFQPNKVVLK